MWRLLSLLVFLLPGAVCAQGWETFDHDMGAGAAVCPYDDAESEAFFCFAIGCLEAGGAPYLRIAVAGSDLEQTQPPLQVVIDGTPTTRLFLDQLGGGDMMDYGLPVDAQRDSALIEALKSGSQATLVLGIGPTAIIQPVTLKGSRAALEQVPFLCDRSPISVPVDGS